ncbi:MAG TPA: thioredoxin domain-containing protein [Verrucomicrobiae bacterium]|nr:thioredoxin domain-containing protein [Verrucomicrobiae bacterium]
MAGDPATNKPNRLIHEKSPYLLQHAYNPVDWFPWGEEAFAKARKESKPIFLSIGYSTCHWCHVMEHESFENQDVAAVMNQYFVCIKVDREERPDIDRIYMTAVQATTGSGGWPMSVWLTPDLKPFFCGTYFPPDARYGRPGFKELLQRIHDVWEANHDAILLQAGKITETIGQYATISRDNSETNSLDDVPLRLGFEQFHSNYDEVNGGFGGAPKFPRPVALNLLFRYFARTNEVAAREMALHTLRAMGEGGMFDQLGGGFHRYSVDDHWLVSHFEKMLYDQAQLVSSYVDAYQVTHDPFYADIARRTCDYVLRDMTGPDGGFYSAEDADSEGVEGKFYVWTRDEIEKALGDRADAFCRAYGVTADGNWEHGLNVLHVASPDTAKLAAERSKLFAIREKRVRPHRDEKILTAWNGLMISALARAAQVLDEPKYRAAAERAAHYLLASRWKNGKLTRTTTVPAMVEDYAFFGNGLVDLYEADFDPQWLSKANELADAMLAQFYDTKDGGFFQTDGHDPSVIVRAKEDYDGAEPSGNSMAALLLLRLTQFTDRAKYRDAAEKTLQLFSNHLHKVPSTIPQMACVLDFYLSKPKQIVIAGKGGAKDAQAMLQAVRERYLPNAIVILADGGESQKTLAKLLPFLETIKPLDGKATAYVCVNYACQLPTNDIEKMTTLLAAKHGK